ncbi:MAG TPA: hypothetical protein VHN18_03540 [Micromonosporaceae bacterium]|nr:hypothetical protein [Micromonosporaceae bacterium]
MTTTPTRPIASYVDHTVVGTSDQVAALIRRHHQAGTFIGMAAPQPVAPADPRIRVRIRLHATTAGAVRRVPATVHTRTARARSTYTPTVGRSPQARTGQRLGIALTITAAVIGLVFTVGYLAARLTAQAVVNAAATLAGFAVIAAIASALLRGGSSGKRHCPGCK